MAAIFEPLSTNLSPQPISLCIWTSGSAKAETETFCEIHKAQTHGLKKNVPVIWDKNLKFEPFMKSAPEHKIR